MWLGREEYEPFDVLRLEDDEWEKMKTSGEQCDDRIVEVHWDTDFDCWRFMRFRDDKPHGNHRSVVHKVIESIRDGVEKEALLERSSAIRNAWKVRHGQPSTANQPPRQNTGAPHAPPPRVASVEAEIRYGPIAVSKWSKVAGPERWAGMYR